MAVLKVCLVGIMTVLISVAMFLLENKCESFRKLPYMARQVIVGCVFGALAVFGTEFGIPFEGAMVNIRDAAPVCAGMLFGGPAGLIAGLIGGIERWFAVYWGVGMYTRVACTVGTIFAGMLAAFARKFLLEDKRANVIYTLGIALIAEVFHMMLVFLTNMDDYVYALTIVKHCSSIMIISVVITSGVAAFAVNSLGINNAIIYEKKGGIAEKISTSLFITVVIALIVMVGFVIIYEQSIAKQQSKTTLGSTLDNVVTSIEYAEEHADDPAAVIRDATRNRRIGNDGIVVVLTKDYEIVSESLVDKEAVTYHVEGEYLEEYIGYIEKMTEDKMYSWEESGIGFYVMKKQTGNYIIMGYYPKEEADFVKWSSVYLTAFAIVIILGAIFMQIYFLIRSIIIRRIREINDKLTRITEGNLDTVVDVGGSEEFISLSDDINTTVDTMKRYIQEAETRMDKDLELAQNIQYSALNREYPESNMFEIYANMKAAKEVGGDFYDFYRIDDDRTAFLVADVSGKGIPAALFMMKSKTLIKSLISSGADVATAMTKANEELCKNNEAEMFVTAWLGILDTAANKVTYANAGHNRPVVMRNGEKAEFLQCRSGFVLAGMEGIKYKSEEIPLGKGDSLFLYTDGVTEAVNESDELYGDDRLLEELDETSGMQPVYMCRYIKNSIDSFAGEAPQFDDITMLAIRIKDECDIDREKVVVPNRESIAEVEEYFEHRGTQLEIPMAILMKVNIIIDEMYSNVVYYSGASMAKISMSRDGDLMTMVFKDNGIEYNPLEKDDPDVTLSADDRKIGGLGIFMVKKMTEEMEYERRSGNNILTIKMRLDAGKGKGGRTVDLDALDAMLGE